MNNSPEFIRKCTLLDVNKVIDSHQERYTQELLVKNQDLQRALKSTYAHSVEGVLRHQVQVLEARLDTFQKLQEDLGKLNDQ